MRKQIEIIKGIIIVLLSVTLGLTIFQWYYINYHYGMQPSSCDPCYILNPYYKVEYEPENLTHSQIKKWVDEEINTQYWLKHKELKERKYSGVAIWFRTIDIDMYQLADKKYEFAEALAHEQIHVKYQTANETFVTYKTITTLFESDNEFLKFISICYANDVLSGGCTDTKYDCGQQLLEYFKNKNVTVIYL